MKNTALFVTRPGKGSAVPLNVLFFLSFLIIDHFKVGAVEGQVDVPGLVVDVVQVVLEMVEPHDGRDRGHGWNVAQNGRKLPKRQDI